MALLLSRMSENGKMHKRWFQIFAFICFQFSIFHQIFKPVVDTSELEIWRPGKHPSFNVPVGAE